MRAEIAKLHHALQATMIYVTHDQVEAMTMGSSIVVMKDGVIQQSDVPLSIYQKPVNLFVAGFIGSPTMNFVSGRIDEAVFHAGNLTTPVKGLNSAEQALSGLILGIRPEDLQWGKGNSGTGELTATIDLAEPMGAETYLHLTDQGTKFIARVTPDVPYVVGETVQLHFLPETAHFFDPETEKALR